MTEPSNERPRSPSLGRERTIRGATITIAAISLGLSGVFTYQATLASSTTSPAATQLSPTPSVVSHENDDESMATAPPPSAVLGGGQPVAVSGGS